MTARLALAGTMTALAVVLGSVTTTGPAIAADDVKVGILLPLSGPIAPIGQNNRRGHALAIDEINADIKAYNDSLLLGERDPRARPLIAKKEIGPKLAAASAGLAEAEALAKAERDTLGNQKKWVAKPTDELKEIKGRMSKAKFKGK